MTIGARIIIGNVDELCVNVIVPGIAVLMTPWFRASASRYDRWSPRFRITTFNR